MATVSFSPAGDVLYAYLAGEIDHDAAQILGRQRIARTLGTALRVQHTPSQLAKVLQLARIPCTDAGQKEE